DHAVELFDRLGARPDLERARALKLSPNGPAAAAVAVAAPVAAPPAPDHRASDVLLMQRLIDASASRELLLQELVSVVEDNFDAGHILLLEREEEGEARLLLSRGLSEDAAAALARDVNWAIVSDGRPTAGVFHTLDDRAGLRV